MASDKLIEAASRQRRHSFPNVKIGLMVGIGGKGFSNSDARHDMLWHWLKDREKSDKQANVNVGAGAELVACTCPPTAHNLH
jgi:hypothetical protein